MSPQADSTSGQLAGAHQPHAVERSLKVLDGAKRRTAQWRSPINKAGLRRGVRVWRAKNQCREPKAQPCDSQHADQGQPVGPAEARDAAIGDRKIHIDRLTCIVNVAAVMGVVMGVIVRIMDMSSMQYRMVMTAAQVRVQRTERRQYETDAEQ